MGEWEKPKYSLQDVCNLLEEYYGMYKSVVAMRTIEDLLKEIQEK